MKIAMIGSGYVGLVSGACLADFGHSVTCVDKSEQKIAALQRGQIPIFEPGLDDVVAANVKAGRLSFASDMAAAVGNAEAVFIAVGTPSRRGDGHADLSYVFAAAEELARGMALTIEREADEGTAKEPPRRTLDDKAENGPPERLGLQAEAHRLAVGLLSLLGNELRLALHDVGVALPPATFIFI